MVIASELGDKTFLLAAIMAMKHPRTLVFSGAFMGLALMSVLSACLGFLLPAVMPHRYTTAIAAILFFCFGIMMIREGLALKSDNSRIQEEIKQVQRDVEDVEEKMSSCPPQISAKRLQDAEEGLIEQPTCQTTASPSLPSTPRRSTKQSSSSSETTAPIPEKKSRFSQIASKYLPAACLQTFLMTILAEWGDKSQISTIALAAAHDIRIVTLGAICGHALCSATAVIGGRWIADKISIKHSKFFSA